MTLISSGRVLHTVREDGKLGITHTEFNMNYTRIHTRHVSCYCLSLHDSSGSYQKLVDWKCRISDRRGEHTQYRGGHTM